MSVPPPSGGNPDEPASPAVSGSDDERALALSVREACRSVLQASWDEARLAGLCDDGAWEVALGALSRLTPEELLARARGRG